MKKIKIAIIGAGPAGATAAYELSKHSQFEIDLYEASSSVGGMAKTISLWGQKVDIGPHRFFSNDPRVNKIWLEVVKDQYALVDRLTRIFYKKKFYYYPLKAFNALFNLGIFKATLCLLSYIRYSIFPILPEDDFETWVTNRFGRRLFNVFFKTYTEKLWGISCRALDSDFAAQRIKKLSLFEAIKNALFKGYGNKHKTLLDQFAYPYGGTGHVYEQMIEEFKKREGKLYLNKSINRILTIVSGEGFKVTGIELEDGIQINYDHVISSMPITLLVSRMTDLPEQVSLTNKKLKFRNTIIVYLKIDAVNLFPDQWIYIHANELETGRITNFRNWVPSLYGDDNSSILALEYWCYEEDLLWSSSDEALILLAKNDINKTGLIANANIHAGQVYKIPRCYPVYERGYRESLSIVEFYLRSFQGLHPIGRYGSFKYNNQDHSILMGHLVAENIAKGMKHDLWTVNSDDEYQEDSEISQSGLTNLS